jgi:hypothetical protein
MSCSSLTSHSFTPYQGFKNWNSVFIENQTNPILLKSQKPDRFYRFLKPGSSPSYKTEQHMTLTQYEAKSVPPFTWQGSGPHISSHVVLRRSPMLLQQHPMKWEPALRLRRMKQRSWSCPGTKNIHGSNATRKIFEQKKTKWNGTRCWEADYWCWPISRPPAASALFLNTAIFFAFSNIILLAHDSKDCIFCCWTRKNFSFI